VPGVGRVCTATVLAEAFQPLVEKDYRALRALRGVADRLLHLICVLLQNQTPYEPSRRALQPPAA
jgi:hypothetical protein